MSLKVPGPTPESNLRSSFRRKREEAAGLARAYPLSVVIPAYNRAELLRDCLVALLANDCQNTEILVVDDSSDPDLQSVIDSIGDRADGIRVIRHPSNRGPAAARNTGTGHSSHPHLFFLDADVVVPPRSLEWIRETLHLYAHRDDVAGVLGIYDPELPFGDFWTNYKNLTTCYLYRITDTVSPYLHTPLFCIRRNVLEEVGGFDSTLATAEDFRMGVTLGSQGFRFIIDRRVRGRHLKRYGPGAILAEDRRRLADLSRLDLAPEQRAFAFRAHRFSRLASLVLPGAALASLALSILEGAFLWPALAFLLLFCAVTLPMVRYMSEKKGLWFALKAGGFFFLEMLWAEGCLARNALRRAWRDLQTR